MSVYTQLHTVGGPCDTKSTDLRLERMHPGPRFALALILSRCVCCRRDDAEEVVRLDRSARVLVAVGQVELGSQRWIEPLALFELRADAVVRSSVRKRLCFAEQLVCPLDVGGSLGE
jgi:hypothetical protein